MDLFPTLSKEFWIGFLVTIAVNIIILTGIDRIFRVVGSTYREVGIAVTTGLFGDLGLWCKQRVALTTRQRQTDCCDNYQQQAAKLDRSLVSSI